MVFIPVFILAKMPSKTAFYSCNYMMCKKTYFCDRKPVPFFWCYLGESALGHEASCSRNLSSALGIDKKNTLRRRLMVGWLSRPVYHS